MKNLIKSSLYLLSFTFLLVSCGGESSTKGNWTSSDIDDCKSDIILEMKGDPEAEQMLVLAGTTPEEFATCGCGKLEGLYESKYEADIDADNISEEDAMLIFLSCFGDLESLIDLGMEMEEESIEEVASSRNLTYTCPLCDVVTEFSCPDCGDDVIWCEMTGDIVSIHCPSCEWRGGPWSETCSSCDKDLRTATKFWNNQSGQNHSDCDW